jgi:hypothetical protein
MTIRKKLLKSQLGTIITTDGKVAYHEAEKGSHLSEGRYTICGLWYEGKKTCNHESTCVFTVMENRTMGDIHSRVKDDCKYSDAKVRGNLLSERKLKKLIGVGGYVTKW